MKKITKILFPIVIVFAMLFSYFALVTTASAQNYPIRATGNISINISGSDIEYHYVADKPNEPDVARFKFAINADHIEEDGVPFTFGNATFKDGIMPPNATGVSTTNPIEYEYGYDGSGTVNFFFSGASNIEYTKLIINDVDYANQTPHTKDEIYEHHIGRGLQFWINNVPYNEDGYNIVVEGSKISSEKLVGSFGWNYKKDTEPDYDPNEDSLVTHGKVDFVQVKYTDSDNHTYTFDDVVDYNNARFHGTGEIYQWVDGNKNYTDRREAWGEALVPYGAELTIKVIPDEGYQLVGLTNSRTGFTATDEIGVYKIVFNAENMGNGADNFHLGAVFSRIDDEVVTNSANIRSGSIQADTSFENGSAKLEVTDANNIDQERREQFEASVSNEGYEIENYLDISLYNSVYKGGKKDANDNYESWDTPVTSLENDATITLELEDDMSGKDIVVVHEKHNGDTITGYETIDVVYNEENNTITFETDSFSNYAIATKNQQVAIKHTIDFNTNGGSEIDAVQVEDGSILDRPKAPTKNGYTFGGWYVDPELNYSYDFEGPVERDFTLYARWINDNDLKDYTVTDEKGNSISFTDEKGHNYKFTLFDILSQTKEEIMAQDEYMTEEKYNQMMDLLKSLAEPYGTLLSLYEIEVYEDNSVTGDTTLLHEGPFKIKIKITDAMKKYNTFKLVYLKNDFTTGEVINLTVDGDYLVGTIPHLSTYILAGSKANNPGTGDNIMSYILMLGLSVIGITIVGIYTKRKKFN